MLLNILQRKGWPLPQPNIYLAPNVNSIEVEKSWLKALLGRGTHKQTVPV